ncbi:g10517 [Coccomyxa elongata]
MLIASILGTFASGRPMKEQAADASASALSRNLLDTGINTGGGANNNYGLSATNCSGNSACSANNGGGGTSIQNNGRRLKNV